MMTSSAGHWLITAPVRKDHITDWITNSTSKGLNLQSVLQLSNWLFDVTGDVAIDHYRIKANWAKGDSGDMLQTDSMRITHPTIRLTARGKFSAVCQRL